MLCTGCYFYVLIICCEVMYNACFKRIFRMGLMKFPPYLLVNYVNSKALIRFKFVLHCVKQVEFHFLIPYLESQSPVIYVYDCSGNSQERYSQNDGDLHFHFHLKDNKVNWNEKFAHLDRNVLKYSHRIFNGPVSQLQ